LFDTTNNNTSTLVFVRRLAQKRAGTLNHTHPHARNNTHTATATPTALSAMPVTATTSAKPPKNSHTTTSSSGSKGRTGSSTGSGSNEGRVDSVFGPSTDSPSAEDSWAVTRVTSRRSHTRPTVTEALTPLSVPATATKGAPHRAPAPLLPFTPRRFVADPACSTSSSERLSVPASDQGTIEEPGAACKHPRMTSTTARPEPGSNLFVAGLPSTVDDNALVRLFSAFGRLITAKVVLNVNNAASRGFGFAQFATVTEADAARHALNGTAVPGHGGRLQIEPSRRSAVDVASSSASRLVTIRNVPVSTVASPNEFLRLLETYGDVAAFDARPHQRGAEATTVTVRFRKSDDAAACAHALHGSSPMKACATPLLARLGAPHERHNEAGNAPAAQPKPLHAAPAKQTPHTENKDGASATPPKAPSPSPAPLPLPQLPAASGATPPWYAAYAAQQQQQNYAAAYAAAAAAAQQQTHQPYGWPSQPVPPPLTASAPVPWPSWPTGPGPMPPMPPMPNWPSTAAPPAPSTGAAPFPMGPYGYAAQHAVPPPSAWYPQ